MRVTVITGGATAERAVAFAGAAQVVAALRSRGHDVHVVDLAGGLLSDADETRLLVGVSGPPAPPTPQLRQNERRMLSEELAGLPLVRGADVVFPVVHGGPGEGGILQALLDVIGVPYTGSGPLASALAVDKDLSKRLFRAAGVPVPAWFLAPVSAEDISTALGWPVIVKPSKQGSTVGLAKVDDPAALDAAVQEAFLYDDEVMIERFIPGRELTVGILGDEALPVGEIIPVHELYDYECKYTTGMAREEFPAKLTPAQGAAVQEQARRAFRALKLGGYARIDFRMTEDGTFYCLEANTLPGMTELSLIPQAAAAAGITFPALCERIVQLAASTKGGRT